MNDERIFAYLLGELPEEESERFEEECFASKRWPREIRAAEHDLVDAYLRGELTPEQRLHFERNYLTTDIRLKRVATAAALLRRVHTVEAEETAKQTHAESTWFRSFFAAWRWRSWALRAGLAAAVVAVVIGALWLARPRTSPPRNFATFTLTIADSQRNEGVQPARVKLAPGTDALRLYLRLPGEAAGAARYRVELDDEEGERSPVDVAGRDAESVIVEIPAARLKKEQYALRLFAVRPDGAEQRINRLYYFIIE
jgi:hypothetical protein